MNTAVAKMPLRQVQDVKTLLHNDQARQQLAAVAAKHMNPERLMRVTANAIRTTPKLQQCEPLSFLGALMQCAALGLEPNTVLGHAYLVPFDKSVKGDDGRWVKVPQVQLIIGYKGLIDLARRSGHITSISANIHYSDDDLWDYEEGTDARLRHRPGPQDGEKLHAYAIAKFTDGGHAYVVLPWAHIMKIRDGSQGWQSAVKFGKADGSPWSTHEDAMAKKTAIRALAKYLPLSVEFSDAVQVDHDGGQNIDYASFAMKPEDGATIDGDFTEADTTAETDTGADAASAEAKAKGRKADQTAAPAAEDKSAPKADEKPAARAKDEEPGVDMAAHERTYDAVTTDLLDRAPVEKTLDFHSQPIAAMKAEAPDMHARLMREVEEARKEEAGNA